MGKGKLDIGRQIRNSYLDNDPNYENDEGQASEAERLVVVEQRLLVRPQHRQRVRKVPESLGGTEKVVLRDRHLWWKPIF